MKCSQGTMSNTKRAADSTAFLMPACLFPSPCSHVGTCVCTHTGEGQRGALGIFLDHFPLMDWARGSHRNLELTGPAGLEVPSSAVCVCWGHRLATMPTRQWCKCGDLNPGLPACTARTFPAEPFLAEISFPSLGFRIKFREKLLRTCLVTAWGLGGSSAGKGTCHKVS